MHVKNHMALWSLWFLWFLSVEYSGNPLYKPLCAFLVFVDLVWFLCGQLCGFWSCVVFGCGLALDADADGCASTCRWALWISCGSCVGRFVVFGHVWFFGSGLRVRSCSCGFWLWSARQIVLMWFLRLCGLDLDARCSMLDAR